MHWKDLQSGRRSPAASCAAQRVHNLDAMLAATVARHGRVPRRSTALIVTTAKLTASPTACPAI
jgi:hypothetical protein